MNRRERVLAALNHRQPDRVPIDFGGHRSSGIAATAYPKLRRALGLEERPIRVYDAVQQLAVVDEDVLDRFGVDTIELGRAFDEDVDWFDWELPDDTIYFEQCYWPFLDEDNLDRLPEALAENMWCAVQTPPGPLATGEDGLRRLAEGARRLRQQTDRAIIGLFGGNLLEIGQFLYRIDNFLMLLAGNPDRAGEFLRRLTEVHLTNLEKFLGAVGPYIDIVLFSDDLGSQNGPQISPAMYRELLQPHHARMWRRAKELADVKVMLHCCGGIRPVMEDLIDAGMDTTNPVQITCAGMDAAELKRDFGNRLTFWGGGCDTRHMLSHGTPEEIQQHVHEQLSILQAGGGFVFQQVHNILADVPPENVIAMFDAVRNRRPIQPPPKRDQPQMGIPSQPESQESPVRRNSCIC